MSIMNKFINQSINQVSCSCEDDTWKRKAVNGVDVILKTCTLERDKRWSGNEWDRSLHGRLIKLPAHRSWAKGILSLVKSLVLYTTRQ